MAKHMTLKQAAEVLISFVASLTITEQQKIGARGASVANACRELERGNAHGAILHLALNLPDARLGCEARIALCRMHPAD